MTVQSSGAAISPLHLVIHSISWCLDLETGRVVEFIHDDPKRTIRFGDVDALIEGYADSLSAGLWEYRSDDEVDGLIAVDMERWLEHCRSYRGFGERLDIEQGF